MKKVVQLQWLFNVRPTGTQISRGFKVHNVITCKSKVQVVVSLGRHWVLTNGMWHVLLQSGNVFELGGITILFMFCCFFFNCFFLSSFVMVHSKPSFFFKCVSYSMSNALCRISYCWFMLLVVWPICVPTCTSSSQREGRRLKYFPRTNQCQHSNNYRNYMHSNVGTCLVVILCKK